MFIADYLFLVTYSKIARYSLLKSLFSFCKIYSLFTVTIDFNSTLQHSVVTRYILNLILLYHLLQACKTDHFQNFLNLISITYLHKEISTSPCYLYCSKRAENVYIKLQPLWSKNIFA